MIITTTETVPGRELAEAIAVVRGSTVLSRHIGRDLLAGLKNIVGGEIKAYSDLQEKARKQSTERMIKDAKALGADAVVNVRYTTSMILQGASEVLAYGTAVKLK